MTTDLALDRDELQIVRLSLRMLYDYSVDKRDTNKAQEVLLVINRMEAAIRLLPDKEL